MLSVCVGYGAQWGWRGHVGGQDMGMGASRVRGKLKNESQGPNSAEWPEGNQGGHLPVRMTLHG